MVVKPAVALVVWAGLVASVGLVARGGLVVRVGIVVWVGFVDWAERGFVDNVAARVGIAAARKKRYFLKLSGFYRHKCKREKIKPGLECD